MISLKSLTGFKAVTADELFFINGGYGSSNTKTVAPKSSSTPKKLVKRPIAHADAVDDADGKSKGVSTAGSRA